MDEQRQQFINDWLTQAYRLSDLATHYHISRPTAYKWIARYHEFGLSGLVEHSRAAHHHPNAVPLAVAEQILNYKLAHPDFGPKKVIDGLRREYPLNQYPAYSTAGELLKRLGLTAPRLVRRRVPPHTQPLAHCDAANRVWSVDYKGDFDLRNGQHCYPLTVTDNYSRYLLQCRALPSTDSRHARKYLEWCFRHYGLPDAIRSDNGTPFASVAIGGLSQLSAWWIKLGIHPERITPAKPQENGRHERMHRSLKAATLTPAPADNMLAQQRRFSAYQYDYNIHRSHEGIGRKTPSQMYAPSHKPYPLKLRAVEYDSGVMVRQVRHNGEIKWRGGLYYTSSILCGEPLALVPVSEGCYELRYSFQPLAVLDERVGRILPLKGWHGREK